MSPSLVKAQTNYRERKLAAGNTYLKQFIPIHLKEAAKKLAVKQGKSLEEITNEFFEMGLKAAGEVVKKK